MPNRFLNTEQKASRAGSFLLYYKTDFHSRMFEQHITNASGGRRGQQSLFLCCRTYNGCKQCYKHAAACACHILLQMRRKQLFISAHILLYSSNIVRHTRRKAFLRPPIKMRFLLFGKRGHTDLAAAVSLPHHISACNCRRRGIHIIDFTPVQHILTDVNLIRVHHAPVGKSVKMITVMRIPSAACKIERSFNAKPAGRMLRR